jgi:hypothetical protein
MISGMPVVNRSAVTERLMTILFLRRRFNARD